MDMKVLSFQPIFALSSSKTSTISFSKGNCLSGFENLLNLITNLGCIYVFDLLSIQRNIKFKIINF